jgi:hypothetical protein
MRDIAIVSFAQTPSTGDVAETESQLLFPVIAEAIERSGIPRKEIGFTCSGSADYLAGQSFAFVGNLEATGAWPPISATSTPRSCSPQASPPAASCARCSASRTTPTT